MSVDDAQTPITGDEARVCPECGERTGEGTFCASCGTDLSTVTRLPTRGDWEDSRRVSSRAEVTGFVGTLRDRDNPSPLAPASGPWDPVVISSITATLTAALPASLRGVPVSVHLEHDGAQAAPSRALGRVVLPDGALVEIAYTISQRPGSARLQLVPDGPASLAVDGRRVVIQPAPRESDRSSKTTPSAPMRAGASSPATHPKPRQQPTSDALSRIGVGQSILIVGYGIGMVMVALGIYLATITRVETNLITGQTSSSYPDLVLGIILAVVGGGVAFAANVLGAWTLRRKGTSGS